MKCFRRSLSLLSVFVLLSVVFSLSVSAQAVDVSKFYVSQRVQYNYVDSTHSNSYGYDYNFEPRDGTKQSLLQWCSWEKNVTAGTITLTETMHIQPIDKLNIFEGTGTVTLTFKNAWVAKYFRLETGSEKSYYQPDSYRVLLYYTDGTMEYVDGGTFANAGYVVTFTPKKVVRSFELISKKTLTSVQGQNFRVGFELGEVYGDTGYELSVDIQSEEVGLLNGIIGWLKGIKDGITNLFDSITELPSKIWSFIENGLKSLFVPDEDFILGFKDDIDGLLSEKLGAVYQVVNILTESWDRIQANDNQNVIEIPLSTIDLPDNNNFSFGGYTVKIVPDGFEFIVDIIKTLIGIVCSVMFVNGLRRKYDEVMGVEK